MQRFSLNVVPALLGAIVFGLFSIAPAHALLDYTFVSRGGSDSNNCDLPTPCLTLQHAHDSTNDGGLIYALDIANFGPLTITKSIKIRAAIDDAIISVTSGNAITVNLPANGTASIRDFSLHGNNTADNGIVFNSGSGLDLEGVRISHFGGAAPNGFGVKFSPSTFSRLIVRSSNINNNGAGSTGAGILISPQAGGVAQGLIHGSTFGANTFGIAVDGTGSTGGINVSVYNCLLAYNRTDGLIAVAGAPVGVLLDRTLSANNGNFGARVIGTGATIRLNNSSIAGNGTGIGNFDGGAMLSYGNNAINANGSDGAPSGSVTLK